MKTKLISASLLLIACIFSPAIFSQTIPGGSTECPLSYSIKKNNGNDKKICNGHAEIRVTFLVMPTPGDIPTLTEIEYKGQILPNIILPVKGTMVTNGKGYINYCVEASSKKNNAHPFAKIPPAEKLVLVLTSQTGVVCRTDNVTL